MAGAGDLLARLPTLLGREVRVHRRALHRPLRAGAGRGGRPEPDRRAPAASRSSRPSAPGRHAIPARRSSTSRAYRPRGGYALLKACLGGERDVESVIATLEDSGLRGLGGAGFPAGRKWRIVRAEPAPRLMAVNIDEGEPGTFKDRGLARDAIRTASSRAC